MRADISGIIARFPALQIAFVVASDIVWTGEPSAALRQRAAETEQQLRTAFQIDAVGLIPEVRVWREAYKAFGVKKTSYRSSVERLLRRVLQGKGLPRISPFIDVYNEISARFLLPVGADDLERIEGDIAFRESRPDDGFVPLGGAEEAESEPPKPGEIVYADRAKILCRRWNWYQDARSAVSLQTSRAVLTVQCLGTGNLEQAVDALCRSLQSETGAHTAVRIASSGKPTVELPA